MPRYSFTDRKTGKSYDMPWDDDTPPPKSAVRQFIWEQENPKGLAKFGRILSDSAATVEDKAKAGLEDVSGFIHSHPLAQRTVDWLSGADVTKAAASRGLTVGGLGEESILPPMEHPKDEGWPGYLARGAYNTLVRPLGSPSGFAGAAAPGPEVKIPDINPPGKIPPGRRLGSGRVFTGPGAVEQTGPIDAEFRVLPDLQIGAKPEQKALPSPTPIYYGGRRGVSSDIDAVTETGLYPRSPQEAAWNALVPERYKPTPSNKGELSPFQFIREGEGIPPLTAKIDDISGGVEEVAPKPAPKPPKESTPATVYSKASDKDVEFLASTGDKAAIAEAKQRPSLKDRFMSEEGSIKFRTAQAKPKAPPEFENWVGERQASKLEGEIKRREFKDLDPMGPDAIMNFQKGDRSGRLKDVADYFDQKFKQLRDAGVDVSYRENYVPQLWEQDAQTVQNAYKKAGLNLNPAFTKDRILETYEQGLKLGLTPKFDKMSELISWYEQTANRALADHKMLGWAKGKGYVGDEARSLSYNADVTPPELMKATNNYLTTPNETMKWMADKASISKNMALSAGIPGTGINAHGFNILARTVIGNPKRAFTAGKYLLNPKSAAKAFDEAIGTAPWAVKKGLQLTTEGHEMGTVGSTNLAGKALQGFLKVQGKLFEDPLFQNVIPALKLKHFNDMVGDMVKGGMGREAAGKAAAEYTNNLYGGINWEMMGRSRDLQNLARMTILAPDWLESNVRNGVGLAKAMLDPKNPLGKSYAKMARNTIGAYLSADVVNYALAGHHMWENAPGHALDIQAGKGEGKDRWIRPFGTAADFLRLPFDMASSAARTSDSGKWQPDFGTAFETLKNRMSIPGRTGADFLLNKDVLGRPMYGKDDYGHPIKPGVQAGRMGTEASRMFLPPYASALRDYATGTSGGEQAIMNSAEMPVRYTSRKKPKHSHF